MGQEEFAEVLEGMINDADAASKAAAGDFGDLSEDQLSGAERALLSAAAGELDDDVVGFGKDSFVKLGDIKTFPVQDRPNVQKAMGYLKLDYIKFDG